MTTQSAVASAAPPEAASADFYAALPGVYDEAVDASGSVRPAWRACLNWFQRTDHAEQASLAQKTERLVFEHFFDPQRGRPSWRLDVVPVILDRAAWSVIEAASIQRARLYNALLADLYGAQTVFSDGLVPPSLIYNDGSFLRPVHGLAPADGHLTFLALDFARDHQGNWRIIDTHTETPAGHGFALANRMVISEVAGNLFRQTGALRIGPFYQGLMDDLIRRSGSEDPLIAVLAPGPSQSAFVGHSFMARYMSQKRVGGSDLRVVGNRVYLKTINGLRKVDLIVRAVESHKADPLELSANGFDGPVGLVEACRHNPDLVVNALGTAVVENRGLSGYLGGICQKFLREDLVLNDTPRLWLGDPVAREYVLSDLENQVIYSAQEGTGSPGEASPGRKASSLDAAGRAALENEIRYAGAQLVAEKSVGFATAPAWGGEGLHPERYAIRVYVASIGGEFSVMPGGLALSVDGDDNVALTSLGARSRDVWVASDDRVLPNISLARLAAQDVRVQRRAQPLQSRTADNLFWLGRYVERADGTLRVIRQTLRRTAADLLALSASERPVRALHAILETDDDLSDSVTNIANESEPVWASLSELCTSPDKLQGLPKTFESIRGLALECRDRLSEDSWRLLKGFSVEPIACHLPENVPPEMLPSSLAANAVDIIDAAEDMLDRLAAFAGMSHENMTRNDGWLFMDLGRRIERALQLSRLLASLFNRHDDDDLVGDDMIFALQAADSFITFRSRYRFAPELPLVLDLLVIDETNPRSLAFQLSAISDHIGRLPKSADDAMRGPDQRLALELLTKVRLADVEALAETNAAGERPSLAHLFDNLIEALPRLSELISRSYFSLADEQPQRVNLNSPR